jgi:SsrA-binding protein
MAKGRKRKASAGDVASNRQASYRYNLLERFECGIVLTGTEVKSLRAGRASLVDGFAEITSGEAWLHNVHIMEYAQGTWTNHAARRKRKLLMHKEEINKLDAKLRESGFTLVPLSLYFKDGRAKLMLALAQGKKLHDKRQTLREKQDRRETDRALAAVRRRAQG